MRGTILSDSTARVHRHNSGRLVACLGASPRRPGHVGRGNGPRFPHSAVERTRPEARDCSRSVASSREPLLRRRHDHTVERADAVRTIGFEERWSATLRRYLPLATSATLALGSVDLDGAHLPLDPNHLARVDAGTPRVLSAGHDGYKSCAPAPYPTASTSRRTGARQENNPASPRRPAGSWTGAPSIATRPAWRATPTMNGTLRSARMLLDIGKHSAQVGAPSPVPAQPVDRTADPALRASAERAEERHLDIAPALTRYCPQPERAAWLDDV